MSENESESETDIEAGLAADRARLRDTFAALKDRIEKNPFADALSMAASGGGALARHVAGPAGRDAVAGVIAATSLLRAAEAPRGDGASPSAPAGAGAIGKLAGFFDQHPLLSGAIGVALGALIGWLAPLSPPEEEMLERLRGDAPPDDLASPAARADALAAAEPVAAAS